MQTTFNDKKKDLYCFHCGEECEDERISFEDKFFCCQGCKTVYQILQEGDLCDYYDLEKMPGISFKNVTSKRFEYLDNESVKDQLLSFQDDEVGIVSFYLPQIHCSACLWLLENLFKINPSIKSSRVDFLKKEVRINFNQKEISLKELVELLTKIGYEPSINLDQLDKKSPKKLSRRLIYQIGLAGFAFGNIMLLSLPEYFGLDIQSSQQFSEWFNWINILIATPVAFYSGSDYFKSAWKSLAQKRLNIDVPIALGVIVLYSRSVYEIVSQTGVGYLDSLCGLLFFLLLGRIFQEKIYHRLSFERDYRSYFPISISRIDNNVEISTPIQDIKKGDKIVVRNGELIPVDSILIKGKGNVDNSFATGESRPIAKLSGDKVYAGGRQIGEAITLEVLNSLNQSKLTQLWEDYDYENEEFSNFSKITDRLSQYFTPIILIITIVASLTHFLLGHDNVFEIASAILIVACPCALALSAPFTFGHALRWLGKKECFIKSTQVIEELANINHIVFDKTGTLTYSDQEKINYEGEELTEDDITAIWNLTNQSNHPLSRKIKESLGKSIIAKEIINFKELEGKGLEATIHNKFFRIGSAKWLKKDSKQFNSSEVYIEIDNVLVGRFSFESQFRKGLGTLIQDLSQNFKLSLLSGDNESQEFVLKEKFPEGSLILFNQAPQDKLKVISSLQSKKNKVMMVGDGLNDAGALKKANVGVSIAENINSFSPASDIILNANQFDFLPQLMRFALSCKRIVIVSFIISLLYNIIGISFAVQGQLSPVFAAILMPVSSITVVSFVSLAVWIKAKTL